MYILKNHSKIDKSFRTLLTHPSSLLQLCGSRFRLIISKQKFRCNSQETGLEKELLRKQSGLQTKYGGV